MNCLLCQKEIAETRRFCSHQCANVYNHAIKPKKIVSLVCAFCGSGFEVRKCDSRFHSKHPPKYCSKACYGKDKLKQTTVHCGNCGKIFMTTRQRFCSRKCACEFRKKHNQPGSWMENGYLVQYTGDGHGIKMHIKIMEEAINRKLRDDECVHHINGDRLDNRLENLQLMTIGEHSQLHRLKERDAGHKFFGRDEEVRR